MLKVEPATFINKYDFHVYLRGNLDEFLHEIEVTRKAVKQAVGFTWDNNTCYITDIYGFAYKFGLYPIRRAGMNSGSYSFTLYDQVGGTCLLDRTITPATSRESVYQEIQHVMEQFQQGWIMCSDCGDWIEYKKNIRNRYFAGIYCPHCWETKWKAIEAKENYN